MELVYVASWSFSRGLLNVGRDQRRTHSSWRAWLARLALAAKTD